MTLNQLPAAEAIRRIGNGEITSEELVRACLDRIDQVDGEIGAWAHLDADYALAQARAADEARAGGAPTGPLHGLPVAVKDIIDTADMPTENGSPIHAGRQPRRDATVVARLRAAGAVILGKTVTTEFAVYSPGKTANPHDPTRTPGGSSSGSAAAVASAMAPAALGSQTNGSVIRPASFCGVFGYKPTHGLISRRGVLKLSRPLDTLGVFTRDLGDLALLGEVLMGYDPEDPDTRPRAAPHLREVSSQEPPVTPDLVFVKSPVWDQASPDCREAFGELTEALGEDIDAFDLPAPFEDAIERHKTVMLPDIAKNLGAAYDAEKAQMSETLHGMIEEGRTVTAVDYNRALDHAEALNAGLDQVFDRYDAIVTPAAPGEAPEGLDATGSPAFCSVWTYLGVPALSLPLLRGANGLPIGVQLIGPRGDDARLLRTARWLIARLADGAGDKAPDGAAD